jgi:thiamine pyrophosphokinase
MSSHHIVREKQEPALLILDLNGFDEENLGQLLEWSPTVVVYEQEFERVDSMGIKIDAVVSPGTTGSYQHGTKLIHTETDPLQDAMKFLTGEQYPAVNIITPFFQPKDLALFVDRINLVIFTPGKKIFPVRPGFSKWKGAGEEIEIIPDARNLRTGGLIPLDNHRFRTEKDGFYSLSFDQAFTFVAENL